MTTPLKAPPVVTRAEFEKIACNRCGACCEEFWVPNPFLLADLAPDSIDPKTKSWLNDVVLLDKPANPNGRAAAKCNRFVRLSPNYGACLAHDERSYACSGFPYGVPVEHDEYPNCSFRVLVMDYTEIQSRYILLGLPF